jgi:hypothetical protein
MQLLEREKRAILQLIIALQWADLRFDATDFIALGEVVVALNAQLSDAELGELVYAPIEVEAADPTRMGAEAARLAVDYAAAITLARPSWAREELLGLLRALTQFARPSAHLTELAQSAPDPTAPASVTTPKRPQLRRINPPAYSDTDTDTYSSTRSPRTGVDAARAMSAA